MAGALARAGQHEQAITVARSISNPDQHAEALAAVAEECALAGQPDKHTDNTNKTALRGTRWHDCCA